MEEKMKLTEGNIYKILFKLAFPIMGTSFIQMAYGLINMIYLGRVSSSAVASVGTASFFTWLANSIIFIPKTGAEIGVSQSVGKGKKEDIILYIKNNIQINIILGIIYGLFLAIFRKDLIGFFNIHDAYVVNSASLYLLVMALGINFIFINPVLTGIFNGYGNSRTPFIINTIGLFINMILDPLLIFGLGPFHRMEVLGAAIATVISQLVVTLIFIIYIYKRTNLFKGVKLLNLPDKKYIIKIFKVGLPVSLQNGMFCIFAMIIARIISGFGEIPIAVQKVGSQIEAISWMSAGGFSTAVAAFVGQNYGAHKLNRINEGYKKAMVIVCFIGVFTSLLLIFGARPIFSIFIPEKEAIVLGADYLRILGYSQLFMCIEITTAGAFNGLSKTIPPSIVSIVFTGLRIPAAIILSRPTMLGLNGVWWAISISSIIKGVVIVFWWCLGPGKWEKNIIVAQEPL